MKRFITYLYEYERETKTKNTGFIRVDERKGIVSMQVSIRNFIRSHEKGKVYAFVWDNGLNEIELGEVGVINGQGETQLRFTAEDVMDSGFSLDDIVGVGIRFSNNGYLASCWKDEMAEKIGQGVISSHREVLPQIERKQEIEVLQNREVLSKTEMEQETEITQVQENTRMDMVTYQKVELNQIRTLPSQNWYLSSNRFLQHGFFSYGYLVLKKEITPTEEVAYLGVPGVYEKPEMVMATLFGFPKFEALPVEIQTAQINEMKEFSNIEKSQEPKTGTFGCWLIPLFA